MPSSRVEFGARLHHVVLGANSVISGAEVQHSLLSPFHEQHHSSSFLIAARIHGLSNIAAGAVIGSNHNSRRADGEIRAGRGFWPGLVSSLKHNSSFASYTLLSKGAYPSEINNPFPFSLLSTASTGLVIYPAFWFEHNMYALERNALKYPQRDRRTAPKVPVEFDYLAPDTMTEIARALDYMDGHNLISGNDESTQVTGIEKGMKPSLILHPRKAARWYKDLVHLNLARCLHRAGSSQSPTNGADPNDLLSLQWRNLGGMVMRLLDITSLQAAIAHEGFSRISELHGHYETLTERYEAERVAQAFALYDRYCSSDDTAASSAFWSKAAKLEEELAHRIRVSRQKDFSDPTRSFTFETGEEKDAILGTLENDELISTTQTLAGERMKFYERMAAETTAT